MLELLISNLAEGLAKGWGHEQLHTIAAKGSGRDLLTTFVGPQGETQIVGPVQTGGASLKLRRGFPEPFSLLGLNRPAPLTRPIHWPDLSAQAARFPNSTILRELVQAGFQRALICPLFVDEQALGFLWVLGRDEKQFEDAELLVWRALSALLSVAADRERLASRVKSETRWRDNLKGERDVLQNLLGWHGEIPAEPIGESPAWKQVMGLAAIAAQSDAAVLLRGETGTGKEVLARWIHQKSARKAGPFVAVNCGAITHELASSELFGHERGAFTGADKRRLGLVEVARGGTLFLDELGDLPMAQQVQLLRFLESGEFRRVGGNETLKSNVRVLSATHRDLESNPEQFRTDLYFRLNVFPINLPALRNRKEDILLFLEHYVQQLAQRAGRRMIIASDTVSRCETYAWPGNIRELRNLVERNFLFCEGERFSMNPFADMEAVRTPKSAAALSDASRPKTEAPRAAGYPDNFDQAARQHILAVLKKSGGRVYGWQGAADRLGLKPSTLQGKMKKLGMKREDVFKE